MVNDNKPDAEQEQGHPEKPNNANGEEKEAGCLESFLGVFKNLFGCIKNAEEAYSHAPPGLSDQLQQAQVPQQVCSPFPFPFLKLEIEEGRDWLMGESRLLNRPLRRKTSKTTWSQLQREVLAW